MQTHVTMSRIPDSRWTNQFKILMGGYASIESMIKTTWNKQLSGNDEPILMTQQPNREDGSMSESKGYVSSSSNYRHAMWILQGPGRLLPIDVDRINNRSDPGRSPKF